MRKLIRTLIACIVLLGLASGCRVHQIPHGETDITVTLNLEYAYDITQYQTIDFNTKAGEPASGYQTRYIINLYKYTSDTYSRTPAYTFVYYFDELDVLDRSITLKAEAANYRAVVWTDYVEAGKETGYYYDAEDFAEVHLTGDYSGCDVRRDAFFGGEDLEMATLLTYDASYEATIQMGRPFARYNFIATDKEQFLDYWVQQLAIRSGTLVKPDRNSLDLNEFKVRFVYPQFLPSTFNLHNGKPVDSSVGVSFFTKMSLREDGNVDLGFDYVFVNPTESKVVVSLEIYDNEGTYISTVSNIEVPLFRSQQTTIQGKILTSGISSGISIDPTYDGEFTVYL